MFSSDWRHRTKRLNCFLVIIGHVVSSLFRQLLLDNVKPPAVTESTHTISSLLYADIALFSICLTVVYRKHFN